jgi:hypothetical protein
MRLYVATVLAPYWEPTMAFMLRLFWRKNFEDRNSPSPGLFSAPDLEYLELLLISYVKRMEKYITFEPRVLYVSILIRK